MIEMTSMATDGIRDKDAPAWGRPVRSAMAAAGMAAGLLAVIQPAAAGVENNFPTAARADYVFACMASNGQTREMLYKCSCSIDAIAEQISYDQYVQAETVIRMRAVPGEKTAAIRDAPWTQEIVDLLRRSQAEAELKCF